MRNILIIILALCLPLSANRVANNGGAGGGSTLRDDLVAWWSFDEASGDALDEHDDHDGTETSGTIARVSGLQGNAADIENDDTEYFSVADHADFVQGGTNPITVNLWVYLESRLAADAFFAQATEILIWITSGDELQFILNSFSTNDRTATTGDTVQLSTWTMFTLTYDSSGNIEIYVDGVANASATPTGSWTDSSAAMTIGLGNGGYMDGLIDETAYWNRHLTDDEITELYNSGSGISYADTAP